MAIKDGLIPEFDHEMEVTRQSTRARPRRETRLQTARKIDDALAGWLGIWRSFPAPSSWIMQKDSFNIRPADGKHSPAVR